MMKHILRLVVLLGASAGMALPGLAWATISIRMVPTATTQPLVAATGAKTVEVFVDSDASVSSPVNLVLSLCNSQQGCSAPSGSWYFFPYAELGGTGFTPLDRKTDSSTFSFTFQPGANGGTTNPPTMGVGRLVIPNAPLFIGTQNVTFSLSGDPLANTGVVTHVITGGGVQLAGDRDINGVLIPDPTGSPTAEGPCEPLGSPRYPGSGTGPCGSYQVFVAPSGSAINCNAGMNASSTITTAWQYNLDYLFGAGNAMFVSLNPREVISFRFKTPSESAAPAGWFPHNGNANSAESAGAWGAPGGLYISVSEKRCDFNAAAFNFTGGTYNACHKTNSTPTVGVAFKIRAANDPFSSQFECTLRPDKYYYVNMRWEYAIQNPGSTGCDPSSAGFTACGLVWNLR
jgi:hypothetical protein